MNNFSICLNAVLPSFLVIMAGYLSKRIGILSESDVPMMNRVAFRAFMLVMCFYNVYNSELSIAFRPKLMGFSVLFIGLSFAASWYYANHFVPDRSRRGVVIQGLYRTNFLIIGLSYVSGIMRTEELGTVAMTSAVVVPMFNILAVIALAAYSGQRPDPRQVVMQILKNPLVVGSVLGAVCLLSGIRLPHSVEIAARDMTRAASPLLLFLLGAFFRFSGSRSHMRELVAVCVGRLVVIPAVGLTAAALLGFRGMDFATLIAMQASATAAASFTMAQQMGSDADLAGDIVIMTSVLCTVTMFAWSFLFMQFGVL